MADRPRVLVLTPDYPPAKGGIQHLFWEFRRHAHRLDTRFVTLRTEGAEEFDEQTRFATRRFGSPRLPHRVNIGLLNAGAVCDAMMHRPECIISAHVVMGPAARTLQRLLGVPVVQYLHADEVVASPGISRFALTDADCVIAVSRHTRELGIAAGADPRRIHVIPPGVVQATRQTTGAVCRDKTILTIATLDKRYKGHDVMARAMPLVLARVPEARWVIIGDGRLRTAIEGLCRAKRIEDAVTFLGKVSDEERDHWLERAGVFAMPSRLPTVRSGGEGFGIVYLEAATWGMPAVAGAVAGALDAVEHERTGLLVDPTDHVELATAVTRLLEDPDYAHRLGQAGRVRAAEFSWDVVVRRIEQVVLDLLDRP